MKQGKKVRPGLSLTGKMVRDRLQNKTLKPADGGGGYSVEDEVMRLNSMTRVEIASLRRHRKERTRTSKEGQRTNSNRRKPENDPDD